MSELLKVASNLTHLTLLWLLSATLRERAGTKGVFPSSLLQNIIDIKNSINTPFDHYAISFFFFDFCYCNYRRGKNTAWASKDLVNLYSEPLDQSNFQLNLWLSILSLSDLFDVRLGIKRVSFAPVQCQLKTSLPFVFVLLSGLTNRLDKANVSLVRRNLRGLWMIGSWRWRDGLPYVVIKAE